MKTHKLSALTIERLTDIKFNILAVPETFRMEQVFQHETQSPCGTAACIAGHAAAVEYAASDLNKAKEESILTVSGARVFLDLTRAQGERLFYLSMHSFEMDCWPAKFERRYIKATTAAARAKVAAERIDWFIKTDGEE